MKKYKYLLPVTMITSVLLVACSNDTESTNKENIKEVENKSNKKEVEKTSNVKTDDVLITLNEKEYSVSDLGQLNGEELMLFQKDLYEYETKKQFKEYIKSLQDYKVDLFTRADFEVGKSPEYFEGKRQAFVDYRTMINNFKFLDFDNAKFMSTNVYEDMYGFYDKYYNDIIFMHMDMITKNINIANGQYDDLLFEELEQTMKEVTDLENEFLKELDNYSNTFKVKEFEFKNDEKLLSVQDTYNLFIKPIEEINISSKEPVMELLTKLVNDEKVTFEEMNLDELSSKLERDYYNVGGIFDVDINDEGIDMQSIRDIYDNENKLNFSWKTPYFALSYQVFVEDYQYVIEKQYEIIEQLKESKGVLDDSLKEDIQYIVELNNELIKTQKEMKLFFQ